MRNRRNACWRTRYLLPMEMMQHATLMVIGISGWIGMGYLNARLMMTGNTVPWAMLFIPIPAMGLIISANEWFLGRKWRGQRLYVSLFLRKWLSFMTFALWAIALYLLISADAWRAFSVVLQGPIMMFASGWSWWVNARNMAIMDPRLNTTNLQMRLSSDAPFW